MAIAFSRLRFSASSCALLSKAVMAFLMSCRIVASFCSRFFALRHVKVHFVSVKVRVVGWTNTEVQTESLVG